MSWWGWLVLALYIVGYALAFRRIAGQMAWYYAEEGAYGRREYPSAEQWFGAILTATFASLIWPVSLPVAWGLSTEQVGAGRLFYTPLNVRERIYKERIAELERQVGIR